MIIIFYCKKNIFHICTKCRGGDVVEVKIVKKLIVKEVNVVGKKIWFLY